MIIRDVLDDDIEVAIKVGFFSFILSLVLKQEKNYVIALGFFWIDWFISAPLHWKIKLMDRS